MFKLLCAKFLSILRHCPICGQFFSPISSICIGCKKKLLKNINCSQVEVDLPFPVYSLWTWGKWDYGVSFLLYFLKGGGHLSVYKFFSQEILFTLPFLFNKPTYVPAPSRAPGLDHAGSFAQVLAKLTNATVVDALIRGTVKKQKHLSKLERESQDLSLCSIKKGVADLRQHKNIIFIDDVLTTGSTALAAYKALGSPKSFKVLVLAYRAKVG